MVLLNISKRTWHKNDYVLSPPGNLSISKTLSLSLLSSTRGLMEFKVNLSNISLTILILKVYGVDIRVLHRR